MNDQVECTQQPCIEVMERQTRFTAGDGHYFSLPGERKVFYVTVWFDRDCRKVPKGYRRGTVYRLELFHSHSRAMKSVKKLYKMSQYQLFNLLVKCRSNASPLKWVG